MISLLVNQVVRNFLSGSVETVMRRRKIVLCSSCIVSPRAAKGVLILLTIAVHCLEEYLNRSRYGFNDFLRFSSPFITGVNNAIYDAVNNYLVKVADRLHEFDPEGGSLQRTESGDQLESLSETNPNGVIVLYGVSGSGKTKASSKFFIKTGAIISFLAI